MSSEFDDIDAGLQPELQPSAPTGEPPTLGPGPVREPEAATPAASAATPDVGQPGAPLPANTAAPGGLVFCENCQANVDPAGRGLCPVCGRFLPDNTVSLVTGLRSKKLAKIVDAYRVDLIDQLFAERGGRDALDVVSRIAIENYALVCAQHKTIEARLDADGLFTATGRRRSAFDMLKGISETIDRLRAELPPPLTRSSDMPGIEAMPTSALELVQEILKRYVSGETLTDFEEGQLSVLRGAMRGQVQLPPDPESSVISFEPSTSRDAGPPVQVVTPTPSEGVAPTLAPAPECKWCNQHPCIGAQHPAYYALHPEAAQAREDKRLNEEMWMQLGKPPRW